MKRRGVEVMYRYRNNRDQPCPWACFSPNFLFISCIVIHNNMTLKSLVWWKNFVLFTLKIKKKILNWHWVVPAIQQHSVGLNDHWKVTEQCLKSDFNEYPVNIQWTFRNDSFNWKEKVHPVETQLSTKDNDILQNITWMTQGSGNMESHQACSNKSVPNKNDIRTPELVGLVH